MHLTSTACDGRFVLDHLLGHKQGRCRREAELLAQGIIEIDGPLTLGQEEDLEPNGTADLQLGRRCVPALLCSQNFI